MNGPIGTCFTVAILFLLAVGLTVAAYLSLVIPDYRSQAFFVAVTSSCIAQLVFFGFLLYAMLTPASPNTPDTATRYRTGTLTGIWLIVVLVTSGMAAAPKNADTFISDQLLIIQLTISLLFFMAVVFQHRQSVVVQMGDVQVQRERVRLEAYAGGLDVLLEALHRAAERFPAQAVEFERLVKRLDTLRTQLRSSSGTTLRSSERPSETIAMEQVEQRLRDVKKQVELVSVASPETIPPMLKDLRSAVDSALALLKRREDVLTF